MPDYDSNGGTPTSHISTHPDYSTPLYDEVNGTPDMPDTVPWCPEEDVADVVPMHGAGMDSIIPKAHRLPEVAYGSLTVYTTNGTGVDRNLGFPINSIIVSNWTPQWARVSDQWVPPFGLNGVLKVPSANSSAKVIWEAPPGFTQPSTLTGGTLLVQFCEEPLAPQGFTIEAAGSGTSALTVSGTKTPADAAANPTDAVDVEAFNMVWNGTTWDRMVEAPGSAASFARTGAIVSAIAAQDNAGTGNVRPIQVANLLGDANTMTNTVGAGCFVYNGTTWDRMRGSNSGATGAVATTAAAPTAANMLSGFANVQATTTTTLVTVPSGRTWVGFVGVSCATTVIAAGAAATVSSVITTANGTGTPTPAAGPYTRVDCTLGAVGAALSPTSDTNSVTGQRLVVQAAGGTCLIQHVGTIVNGTAPQASGWAIGELM